MKGLALALGAVLGPLGAIGAQQLNLLLPAGASRGQEIDVRCYGRGLKDTTAVVWLRAGIEVVSLKAERDDRVLLRLRVPADCELGTFPFLLQTRRGLSRAKAFHIGPLPSVAEGKDHGTRAKAQRIELDTTVDGRILPEDEDWYAIDVEAGQVVRVEAEGIRLGLYDLDLQLEVFGPDGHRILRSDDTALGKADPMAAFTAQQKGTYTIALRDVAWRGSTYGAYRLHVGTFARPIGLLPAGGRPGETITVTMLGDAAPATAQLTLPERPGLHEVFPMVAERPIPTPVRVVVDDRPSFLETSPPAQAPAAPCAFHGVVAATGEEDRHAFAATKGKRIELRVLARNLRSPLDPVLRVRDQAGKQLAIDDDGLGLDGRIRFTPKASGTFFACVTDHLGHGSAASFYRLEVGTVSAVARTQEAVPGRRAEDFGLSVPAGRRNATIIQTTGLSSRDGVTLTFANLPAGVHAAPIKLPSGGSLVPLVLRADGDAALTAALANPVATAERGAVERTIRHRHAYPTLRVRNNQSYAQRGARALPVAVTQATPFDVAADAPKVPVVRSGSLSLPVRATRDQGFTGTITIRALWLPPGLSASTVRLTKTQTSGQMAFNANSSAALGSWPIVLAASASVDGITQTVSTEIMTFELQEPWITAKLPRAKVEQGAAVTFAIELERKREFRGKVTAELGRVPRGVTAKVPAITDDTTTLSIALQADAKAQVGRHRSLYVRLSIETPEGVIQHTAGGGELRVDRPLPPELRDPGGNTGGSR